MPRTSSPPLTRKVPEQMDEESRKSWANCPVPNNRDTFRYGEAWYRQNPSPLIVSGPDTLPHREPLRPPPLTTHDVEWDPSLKPATPRDISVRNRRRVVVDSDDENVAKTTRIGSVTKQRTDSGVTSNKSSGKSPPNRSSARSKRTHKPCKQAPATNAQDKKVTVNKDTGSRAATHRSRRQKGVQKSKADPCTFLNRLPGEIRNKIYEFVVPQTRVLICKNKPEKEQLMRQRSWQWADDKSPRSRTRLYCLIDNFQQQAGIDVPFGLLAACKQTKTEVELFMYSRTVFCFESPKVINMFLSVAPKQGIKAIQSIQLCQGGYGEPKWSRDSVFKVRHDRTWTRTYERIGKELTSLRSLKLDIRIQEWPASLSAKDHWHKSLMQIIPRPIHVVDAQLRHRKFEDRKLAAASRKLEDCMMSEKGRHDRDVEETKAVLKEVKERRAKLPSVQATRCLRISMSGQPASKPVKTSSEYTQSAANWEWKYGKGNTVGKCVYSE